MAEVDGSALVAGIWESGTVRCREVVRIDDEFTHADGQEMVKGVRDQWTVENGDHRFGQLRRQWSEPLPQSCPQNKSLVHAPDLRSDQRGCNRKFPLLTGRN